jgi:putative lipoprotein
MKKFSLILLSALACWGFTSCENYELPNPPAQSNPQEPVFNPEGVTVTSDVTDNVYSLEALEQSASHINIATVTPGTLPAGYRIVADVFFSANGFESQIEVPSHSEMSADSTQYTIYVTPADLQEAYYNGISKGPKEKTLDVRMLVKAQFASQTAIIGGPDNYYTMHAMKVLPVPSDLTIESAYYILGTINDWSVANAVPFRHSGADPYDDPVFTINVDITPEQAAAGWWWKIVPQSTYETGNWVNANGGQYGVQENGSHALSGMLVGMTVDEAGSVTFEPGAGCINEAGQWQITINLEEGTYAFTSAIQYLYCIGNSCGWNFDNAQRLFTSNYSDYSGYAYLNGEFKFTSAPDWNHTNFGNSGTEGTLSTDGGAGNLSAEQALYWCNVNIDKLTYSLTKISTIGMIGNATPQGWDASTALTSDDYLVWKGTVAMTEGEFKFRANDNWDINLGGSLDDLVQGGDNIKSPGAGTYEVTLDLSKLPYTATFTKK